MVDLMFRTTNHRRTIVEALLEARRLHGGRHVIAEDADRVPATYDQLLSRALILARVVEDDTEPAERVGLLLPGSIPTLVAFLGCSSPAGCPRC